MSDASENRPTQVLSLNTDGILIDVAPGDEERVAAVIKEWEQLTGFEMEQKAVKCYRRLNVNTYIAIGVDGSVKSKGHLNFQPGLDGDPNDLIIAESIAAFMKDGTSVRDTIMAAASERNLFKFARLVTTNGPGFTQGEERFGNVVRVYRSNDPGLPPITSAAHGKVSERQAATGCRIFRDLSVWPEDIDIESYIADAEAILDETSVEIDNRMNKIAREVEGLGLDTIGQGGSTGIRTGGNFSGSRFICAKVSPGKNLLHVLPGVLGAETMVLRIRENGRVIGEIHRLPGLTAKEQKRLKTLEGTVTNGPIRVFGKGLTFEPGDGAAPDLVEAIEVAEGVQPDIKEPGALEDNDDFLRLVFGKDWQEAYVISMSAPPDSEAANWSGGPARFARGSYLNERMNNFVGISLFNTQEGGATHRRADDFKSMHCLFLDDIGTKAEDPSKYGFGPPTLRLETSPGNYAHIYALERPITDRAFAEALINASVKSQRLNISDKGAGEVTRVFRLPYGLNNKLKYGSSFTQRIDQWNPSAKYSAEQILTWLGEDPVMVKAVADAKPPPVKAEASDKAMSHPVVAAFDSLEKLIATKPKRDGWIHVECPWSSDHSEGREKDGAAIQVREDGTWRFNCHHGHCQGEKTITKGGQDIRVKVRGSHGARDWLSSQGLVVPRPAEKIWERAFEDSDVRLRAEEMARNEGSRASRNGIDMSFFGDEEGARQEREERPGETADEEPLANAGGSASEPLKEPKWSGRDLFDPWAEYIAPEFPLRTLPDAVRGFVENKSKEMGACPSAMAMSCLAVASAAIRHDATLSLNDHGQYIVRPRLWVLLAGAPSQKKSPVQSAAKKPLEMIEAREKARVAAAWGALPVEERKALEKSGDRPEPVRFVVTDTTTEALAVILSKQRPGLLIDADELSQFIGQMDRYSGGKGGGSANRGFWLQAYTGGRHSEGRIGNDKRKPVTVETTSVSLLGGVQPKRLAKMGDLDSDGLLQRFLPVMMAKARMSERTFDPRPIALWNTICQRLTEVPASNLHLSPEAAEVRWRVEEVTFTMGQSEAEGEAWQGFVGKLLGVWGSLTLILHHLHGNPPQGAVSGRIAELAEEVMRDFIIPHGLVFYRTVFQNDAANQRSLATFIATRKTRTVKRRDISRGVKSCGGLSPAEIGRRMEMFALGGWVEPTREWPPPNEWIIRPGLAEIFQAGIAKQREIAEEVVSKIKKVSGRSDDQPGDDDD
jgi:hypothetical protein